MSPAPYDITQEVWGIASAAEEAKAPADVLIAVEHLPDPEAPGQNVEIIFSAWHRSSEPDETTKARLMMAARAPTFYRLLEEVVAVGNIPSDLELVIKLNLYRAAPKVFPKPELHNPARKSAWQKLLDDLG